MFWWYEEQYFSERSGVNLIYHIFHLLLCVGQLRQMPHLDVTPNFEASVGQQVQCFPAECFGPTVPTSCVHDVHMIINLQGTGKNQEGSRPLITMVMNYLAVSFASHRVHLMLRPVIQQIPCITRMQLSKTYIAMISD